MDDELENLNKLEEARTKYQIAYSKWETLMDARHIIAEFSIENTGKDDVKADIIWEARNHLNSFVDKAKQELDEMLDEYNKAFRRVFRKSEGK